jgi:hypothetical protein
MYLFSSKWSVGGPGFKGTFHHGPPTHHLEEKYYLPQTHLLPPDDEPQMGQKHVQV